MHAGPRSEFRSLKRFLAEIEKQFLSRHLVAPKLGPANREETLDVAAYVVLAHGAFENYFEGVALWAADSVERSWISKKRASRVTASLLLYRKAPDTDIAAGVSIFDNIRLQITDAKGDSAKRVNANNGINAKHLRSILGPLGINVSNDPVLVGSLNTIVSMRHQWAHQYRFGAKVTKSAGDILQAVADCVQLAESIADDAIEARP